LALGKAQTAPFEAKKPPGLSAFRSELPEYIRFALTYFLLAWLAYNVYDTVHFILVYYVPVPIMDYWRVAEFLRDYQSMHVAVLWKQHNEHRIIFPEVIFALDMLAAHGRFILPISLGFICYSLAWGILSFTVISDSGIAFSGRLWAVLMAGVVAFGEGLALVLAQPFLLQWPLMQLGSVVSLFCLKKAADTSQGLYLAGAIAAAVLATYSSGNGLLLWPLLLAIGAFIRLSRRSLAVLAVSGALFSGLYFVSYRFNQETNLRSLFLHPWYVLGFFGSYLSMPFGGEKSPSVSVTIGLTSLAVFATLLAIARRFHVCRSSPVVVLGGFYLFTLLTLLITVSGRVDVNDPNFTAARVTRYLTVPFLTWSALLLLCFWMSARLKWQILTPRNLTVVFSLLLMLGFYKLKSWRQESSQEFADYQFAAMSLDLGLTDSQIDTRLFQSPEFITYYVRGLKANHLAVFYRSREKWLGQDVASFGGVQDATAAGEIVYTYPVEHGVEVVGWVDSVDTRDPRPQILLANESGKIVGFGRQPAAGFPADLHIFRTPNKQSWVGFVNLRIPSRLISAYLVKRRGLMPVNGVSTLPTLQLAATDQVHAPLPAVLWKTDAIWTQDRLPVKPRFGWQPSAPIYCSWSGHDENTGRAMADFATPASGCVVLPILHGPSIDGASAELIDADSAKVLAELPFRAHDPLWTLWRVPLPSSAKRLRFLAVDNGKDWGQWLAVSAPLQCK
jgi:hypothetical protein